jgi:hypothetical protein
MVFNATFSDSSVTPVYDGGQSFWWRNSEYPEKITDLLHEKTLSHNIVVTEIYNQQSSLYALNIDRPVVIY